MNKKILSLALAVLLLATTVGASAATYTPGTYEATAKGFGGDVTVAVTVDADKITAVTATGAAETAGIGTKAIEQLPGKIVEANSADVDAVASATITSDAIKTAVKAALAEAAGTTVEVAPIVFTPGTYTGKAQGYNGVVELSVTFSENAIEAIEVVSHKETAHVGDVAFPIVTEYVKEFTSTGVDGVSGATVTSNAIKQAVENAAAQAGCDAAALRIGAKPFAYEAKETIEDTYDVIVVGAGGAGMAAGAAAAQNGATVIVLEANVEMGGNTLVSGGSFQAVVPAYVFDPENPTATTAYEVLAGEEVTKAKSNLGNLATLKEILNWNEAPFDGTIADPEAVKTVEDYKLPERGVHAEFLPTLLTLKDQIRVYLAYAEEQMAAGVAESDLILFSTEELHIFQTYYGGLRLSADKSYWIYNDVKLVEQLVRGAYPVKQWLADQGAVFSSRTTGTLIGCLYQRINGNSGGVVDGEMISSKWGAYFKVPENTIVKANEKNQIMTRTSATELIVDETGRVAGVKAVQYDGTEVILHATKGVILATGGYGANIPMVVETNEYWSEDDLTADILTTNRSTADGSGIIMGQAAGAAVTGMGFTQLMPLGWVDNGDLSGGAGENVIFIASKEHENAGQRYVDESAERDVLSQGAFDFGDEDGVYIELANGGKNTAANNVEGRTYYCTLEEAGALLGIDPAIIEKTVTEYDAYVIGASDVVPTPAKNGYTATIGTCDKDENGKYLPETYRIETLKVRFMRPSTHHTMGGLMVDTDRRVLREDGTAIEGLYAAGEVTGGVFAGNRLGGNAITEILVSGKIAGESAAAGK